nr:MAG TPA: hypothetical protein [Caudoviricetes sp.]DAU97256.1 MAG TPA: hypothetical protein [Caudoviricetes sp.]
MYDAPAAIRLPGSLHTTKCGLPIMGRSHSF